MICSPEAQEDLAETLGLDAVSVSAPTWDAHVYTCDYRYADASFTLSVHQAADRSAASATFATLGRRLTRRMTLDGLGQDAVTTANGSVLVQKDDDVLLVDVAKLPARFGVPPDTRANAAISIAATIMGCWTGS
jgi:predicted regulator of Ras-like GTPase activity (Roadblock/LC7/MglB family)